MTIGNVITDSTTSRTLSAAADANADLYFTNAGTIAVTLPNDAPIGMTVNLIQGGTGQVQCTAASGATLSNRQSFTSTAAIYAMITLEVIANSGGSSALWVLTGDGGGASSAVSSPVIQSIQQATVTIAAGQTTGTATITAVVVANSYVHYDGTRGAVSTFAATTCLASVTLTNATTVTATRNTSDASNAVVVQVTVMEFIATTIINNIQQGTIAIGNAATTNTATITAVVLANSFVMFQGQTFGAATDETNFARCTGQVALTNTTTVTATRNTASATTLTVGFVVVEFKAGVLTSATQSVTKAGTTIGALASITSVDPRYSILIYGGGTNAITSTNMATFNRNVLADQIGTLTMTGSASVTSAFMVVEFSAVQIKSVQRIVPKIAANATTGTVALNAVTTNKCLVNYTGHFADTTLTTYNNAWETMSLTSSVLMTATRNITSATIGLTGGAEVIDWQ